MTFSLKNHSCEWCDSKEGLIEGSTGDGTKLLVCRDSKACGSRWPDVPPVGRVGVYEGTEGGGVSEQSTTAPDNEGCPVTRWDGPYSYRCGLGGVSGICHLHGPFASAFGEVGPEPTADPVQDCTVDLVQPEPGQTVVVTVAKLPPPHILEAMGDQLKRSFPDNRCVVMEEGTSLSVEDDDVRSKVDALAAEFERRSKEAHDRQPDSVPSMARDSATWASYRDAAYELRTTFGVPYDAKGEEET